MMSLLNWARHGSMVVACEKPIRYFGSAAAAGRRGRAGTPYGGGHGACFDWAPLCLLAGQETPRILAVKDRAYARGRRGRGRSFDACRHPAHPPVGRNGARQAMTDPMLVRNRTFDEIARGRERQFRAHGQPGRYPALRCRVRRCQSDPSRRELRQQATFKGVVAHSMLGAGLISSLLGNRLPGAGTVYLAQDCASASRSMSATRVTSP